MIAPGAVRCVETGYVARALGHAIAARRMEATGPLVAAVDVLDRIDGLDGQARHDLADAILETAQRDPVYDSEGARAARATFVHLSAMFGSSVPVRGYLDGERLDGRTLTGTTCPRCANAPLVYGYGGGVACLDKAGCGYWYCE